MNQPYVQQPYQPQPHPPYPQMLPQPTPVPWQAAPKRNVGMIVGGSVLFVIGLLFTAIFLWNLKTYLTVEDNFMSDPVLRQGGRWLVDMVKDASMHRMTIFGPIAGIFSIGGLVLGGLGLRKK